MLVIYGERQESYFTITREYYEAVRFQPSIFSKASFFAGQLCESGARYDAHRG